MREIDEASMAVAKAAKLSRVQVVPMYPITPQTHIVERIADFINDGEMQAEMIHVESEHSAMSAAIGASATGVRVFTATASQGLALMNEMVHVASGNRLPIVMAVANRALSAPINIWNDHQDSISSRDTGWLQLYVESSQEALDTVIQAYKIAETALLPVMVCLDGFTLSHVYEPTDVPEQEEVDKFLPEYKARWKLDPENPTTIGPISLPWNHMEIKQDQQKDTLKSIKTIKQVHNEFAKQFKRSYGNGLIEEYKCKDANTVLICMGSVCGTARVVIDNLRKKGKKVGLLKLKCFRPLPEDEIKKALKNKKYVAVIDRALSYGVSEGPVCSEIKTALQCEKTKVKSYIAGLGGRDVTEKRLIKAINDVKKPGTGWLN
ncbi:pyruvate ferredoxin oxidoreductase [Candidatus Woesearchaeota archaeon]|nr:pyruvate ferredoxin oxidoreductase [Candidatus Woesearchaeota archaeon]